MITNTISNMNEVAWNYLEDSLTPTNADYTISDIALRTLQCAVFLPAVGLTSTFNFLARCFENQPTGFKSVLADSRLWDEQPIEKIAFSNILLGTATSEYQYSGKVNCPNAQWAEWEKETIPIQEQSQKACDFWNRPEEFVSMLKKLNMNTFRFSVEWSKIEPERGKIDESALKHYVYFCRLLKKAGIEPMVTLHHFTHPVWFEELGAFEKEENIAYFVNFSQKVFTALKENVNLWCTINEPSIVAFSGYVLGDFPPNKTDIGLSAKVLKNLLQAHCDVYRALKPINPQAQIGLVNQVLKFMPYRKWNPLETLTASYLTRMTNDVVMKFLETGSYHYKVPFLANVFYEEREISQVNDFIGVNCYARPLISQVLETTILDSSCDYHEEMTLMPFREDPAAIYEAIMEVQEKTHKPIYITETGISTNDETQLKRYMERALYSIYQAKLAGADIRGVYWWSLMNNFEWNLGWQHNFGICDKSGNPRDGADPLLQLAKKNQAI